MKAMGRFDAERLRQTREARGISRRMAAYRAGMWDEVYVDFETGKETPNEFWTGRLAHALGCKTEDLMRRD